MRHARLPSISSIERAAVLDSQPFPLRLKPCVCLLRRLLVPGVDVELVPQAALGEAAVEVGSLDGRSHNDRVVGSTCGLRVLVRPDRVVGSDPFDQLGPEVCIQRALRPDGRRLPDDLLPLVRLNDDLEERSPRRVVDSADADLYAEEVCLLVALLVEPVERWRCSSRNLRAIQTTVRAAVPAA